MNYMPFFFDLKRRPCLLVGGGRVATRKARLLANAGAVLIVVAPRIADELQQLAERSQGRCYHRDYQTQDLQGVCLIICATDNPELNQQISQEAQARQLPINVVDSPALCTIITPSIIDRSPLMIAISSGGEAPVLVRQLRAKLEVMLPSAYGALARLAGQFRDRVKAALTSEEKRLRFWEKVFNGAVAERALAGHPGEAGQILETLLADETLTELCGEVYLVGAGPGDPDLLTFKALRLMQQADVVLYDRLVSEPIMNLVRRDADRIYVGKRSRDHALPQQDINQLLIDLAKQGKRVLRLKGGDPFIFGRGGEEIERLADHHIRFQVVPGITAASGCAAYAGIPLTHRDYAQSVRFITGHNKAGTVDLPWDSLLDQHQTLVFYMGLVNLSLICAGLCRRGRDPHTPAALIEKGTLSDQRVITGTLSTLPELIESQTVQAPTLLIIGGVVNLHQQLRWYQ